MPARKSTKRVRGAPKPRVSAGSVFLNVPYDANFENLLLAYIAAISAFGFTPRATLEIPFGQRRLDRILALIQQSQYSIHDLSRVQLDRKSPRTPRFNMPFELGLTVALEKTARPDHAWVVCESFDTVCGHAFLLIPCAEITQGCEDNAQEATATTQNNSAPVANNSATSTSRMPTPSGLTARRARLAHRYHIPGLRVSPRD